MSSALLPRKRLHRASYSSSLQNPKEIHRLHTISWRSAVSGCFEVGASSKTNLDQHIYTHPPAHTNHIHHLYNKSLSKQAVHCSRMIYPHKKMKRTNSVIVTSLLYFTRSLKFHGDKGGMKTWL